jgi:hypothetical protein
MDSELKQYLDEFRERTDAQFREMREENAQFRDQTATEFRLVREEITATKTEMKLHFDSTAERFESKFELLSEGIGNVDQKLGREAADIRSEMRQGFADTQALIRFSLKLPAQRRKASRRPTRPRPKRT